MRFLKDELKILAITMLASLDQGDLADLGFRCDVESLVRSRAQRALEIGCDGVVSSSLEISSLRKALGDQLIIVVSGIRPMQNRPVDDQKRVVTSTEAFQKGADFIVAGRPIRGTENPRAKAEAIQAEIVAVFA